MKAIVAVDKKWGIGKNNGLLFQIAEDMRFFRQQTLGKTVVMGRKTLESFPNGKPLKNRKNVVLGNPKNLDGITSVKNFEELKTALSGENLLDVYVIGGGSVYNLLLPYCDSVLVTKVEADGDAEVFFPNLDEDENFFVSSDSGDVATESGYTIRFVTYQNKNPKTWG